VYDEASGDVHIQKATHPAKQKKIAFPCVLGRSTAKNHKAWRLNAKPRCCLRLSSLQVAVVSALNQGGLIGYCLFLGDPGSDIYK